MINQKKEESALEKAGRNSNYIWAIFGVLGVFAIFVFKISTYIYDTNDLPPRVKQVEKDVDKLKSLPERISSLENRTSALELQLATNVAEIKSILLEVRNDQNIIKTQIVKTGLEYKSK